jgi:hypothetical protein
MFIINNEVKNKHNLFIFSLINLVLLFHHHRFHRSLTTFVSIKAILYRCYQKKYK